MGSLDDTGTLLKLYIGSEASSLRAIVKLSCLLWFLGGTNGLLGNIYFRDTPLYISLGGYHVCFKKKNIQGIQRDTINP